MFDGIAEHEVAEREVAEGDCFFFFFVFFLRDSNCLFFYLFLFTLFLFNDIDK